MTYKTPKTTKSSRSKSSSGSKRINRKSAEWLEMSSEQKQKILDERKKAANLRRQKKRGKSDPDDLAHKHFLGERGKKY